MSAIKTHDHWEVINGGEITLPATEAEENAPTMVVTAVRVSRSTPHLCNLMTKKTYCGGSISRTEHFIQQGQIVSTVPSLNTTDFNVSTRIGGEKLKLNLTSIKSDDKNCVVM